MKYLIIILLFVTNLMNAQSLAQLTGENNSLWNALAVKEGVNPSTWTTTQFRVKATEYATSLGLVYYNDKTNGNNNLEILHYVKDTVVIPESMKIESANISNDNEYHTVFDYSDIILNDTLVKVSDTIIQYDTTTIIDTLTQIDTVQIYFCDCRNMSSQDVKKYSISMLELSKSDTSIIVKESALLCYRQSKKYYTSLMKEEKKYEIQPINNIGMYKVTKKRKRKRVRRTKLSFKKWLNMKFGWCLK